MKRLTMTGVVSASLIVALGGCGGGDDDKSASAEVPASASASTAGLVDYLKRLVAIQDDRIDPVDISLLTPQTSETDDPVALD